MLDGSDSIDGDEWEDMNDWIRDLIDEFEWGPKGAALAVVQFSDSGELELQLNSNKDALEKFFNCALILLLPKLTPS